MKTITNNKGIRTMLKQFIRDDMGQRIGVVVAITNHDGGYNIGWSVCNKKDKFDNEFGTMIAIARAEKGSKVKPPMKRGYTYVPTKMSSFDGYECYLIDTVQATIDNVRRRADNYFKVKVV
jgi:hypothetical protein